MSNRAWMPLHIDDYIRDTDHLSATEHGAYLLLIMKYWRDGGLPADEGLIRRYAKLSVDQWAESRDVIAALFDAGWCHKRIDEELAKAADIIEKRKAAGKKTQFTGKRSANDEQVPEDMLGTSTAPLTSNLAKEEPTGSSKKRGSRLPDGFLPDAQAATECGLSSSEAEREAAKFRDYWISQPGQKGVKLDWAATWRNWCRNAVERRPRQQSHAPPKKITHASMWTDEAIALGIIDEPASTQDRRLGPGLARGHDQGPDFPRRIAGAGDREPADRESFLLPRA